MKENTAINSRRNFLFKSLPAIGITLSLFSIRSAYSTTVSAGNFLFSAGKKNSGKPTYKGLVLNTESKVIHFPGAKLFAAFNRKGHKHIRIIEFSNWEKELNENRFERKQSGYIIEQLALRELLPEATDKTLNKSASVLSLAFSDDYRAWNTQNWRVYDLLLQLIALNTSVLTSERWLLFNHLIAGVDVNTLVIPERCRWITNRNLFNSKAAFIAANSEIYKSKLKNRVIISG